MLRHYLGPHTAQARSLSSNKEYVVHPTHIHPNVDTLPSLCQALMEEGEDSHGSN